MTEILLINPAKRKKKKPTRKKATRKKTTRRRAPARKKTVRRTRATTRKVTTMPKKRRKRAVRKRSYTTTRKTTIRANPRRGKGRVRRAARAIASRSSLRADLKAVMKDMPLIQVGMFATKFSARKWGGATETDPSTWDWAAYAKAGAGAIAASFLMNMAKPGWGRRVLAGGANYLVFKMIQNELIERSATAKAWLGEDDYMPTEYFGETDPDLLELEQFEGPVMYDEYGRGLPADDSHRFPAAPYAGELEPPTRLGGTPVPVTQLGAAGDVKPEYAKAWWD